MMPERTKSSRARRYRIPTAKQRFQDTIVAYTPPPPPPPPRPTTSKRRPKSSGRRTYIPRQRSPIITYERPPRSPTPDSTDEDIGEFTPPPIISQPKQTIQNICVGETSTQIKMTPVWFEQEDQDAPLQGIVYPSGVTDTSPFHSIARYRDVINKTNNFRRKSVDVGKSATETLILALHNFAQQFGGNLSFTKKTLSFTESVERTACGIANLGSAHLLAANHIPTAKYVFKTKLNYEKDLAKSDDTMLNFVASFATAIAEILQCSNDYVRVLSVEKNDDDGGKAEIDFGITTPDQIQTQILASELEDHARTGFQGNRVLRCVRSDVYRCEFQPLILYLQLKAQDFAVEHNFDYKKSDICQVGKRGGYPYYVPIGWYRHALDVATKYSGNQNWLDYRPVEDAWPVAFHGTHPDVVYNITKDGLSAEKVKRDLSRKEAVRQMGPEVDKPGLYLATRCSDGAHPFYTKTFSVFVSETKIERFRVVFQCRVKPGSFTTHICPITNVETWRVVDPTAVRPYGILVRKRRPPKREGDESEDD